MQCVVVVLLCLLASSSITGAAGAKNRRHPPTSSPKNTLKSSPSSSSKPVSEKAGQTGASGRRDGTVEAGSSPILAPSPETARTIMVTSAPVVTPTPPADDSTIPGEDSDVSLLEGSTSPNEGVISTLVRGTGGSQIESGTSKTFGNGQVFTSKENGGLARVLGRQSTRAQGSGASRGNADIIGSADLSVSEGSPSTTTFNGNSTFLTGSGASEGSISTKFSAFVNPNQTAGDISTVSGASGEEAAQSTAYVTLGSLNDYNFFE